MRRVQAVAAAVVLSCGTAAVADGPVWLFSRHDEGVSLHYGTPETDHVEISLYCPRDTPMLNFAYWVDMREAPDGLETVVTLSDGAVAFAIPVVGARMEMDDSFVMEAVIPPDDELARIFTQARAFTVTMEGVAPRAYTLAGSEADAAAFFADCRPAGG